MLENDLALVTGASRGIGRAIALALARAGARVVGTATSAAGAAALSAEFAAQGVKGRGAVLDAGDGASIEALVADLEAAEGLPTILVNNAAITRDMLLVRMKSEDWDQVIATNLTAVFRISKACLRRMLKERRGRIINVTSIVGLTGNPGQTNYSAAKAGLLGFTKSLAREVASRGITVNAVAPGFVDTDMTRALSAEQRGTLQAQIPLGRLGSPEDIAAGGPVLRVPPGRVHHRRNAACQRRDVHAVRGPCEWHPGGCSPTISRPRPPCGWARTRQRQKDKTVMSTVEQQVKAIVAEQLGVKQEQVTNDASFVDDLGADSLDTVELVMALEEEFEIEIPDEDAEKITTVHQAIDYINERRTKS